MIKVHQKVVGTCLGAAGVETFRRIQLLPSGNAIFPSRKDSNGLWRTALIRYVLDRTQIPRNGSSDPESPIGAVAPLWHAPPAEE